MVKEVHIVVSPKQASSEDYYLPFVAKKLKLSPKRIKSTQLIHRSVDARKKQVKINLRLKVFIDQQPPIEEIKNEFDYQNVSNKQPVVIIGAGPAGLFAGLKLLELGFKPVIIERGKDVHTRKRDIANIHRNKNVDADSNYSFGEGGAGTYSDGKLYTRSKKRGSVKNILQVLRAHGADNNILIDAHPHIGTNKLPGIIESIRETIINHGGEVHFQKKFTGLVLNSKTIKGVRLSNNLVIESKAVILATGHSARDVYRHLHDQNILLEAKPFAMGVRIEHAQHLIDSIQYSCANRGPYLPAASYSLVQQVNNRGVYSFCMCPGGIIVPASTAPDEMVVNGMSPSMRNTPFANSGLVVEIQLSDLGINDPCNSLKGIDFQANYEKMAFANGGDGQIAPAQRVVDFVENRVSATIPESSFRPGLKSSPMHEWMPEHIQTRLASGLQHFGRKMHGYFTNEALLIGVESRTSSPIRIPREKESYQHPQIEGLYPCGEGAGYAGGIASSAIDGENCAAKVAEWLASK